LSVTEFVPYSWQTVKCCPDCGVILCWWWHSEQLPFCIC